MSTVNEEKDKEDKSRFLKSAMTVLLLYFIHFWNKETLRALFERKDLDGIKSFLEQHQNLLNEVAFVSLFQI